MTVLGIDASSRKLVGVELDSTSGRPLVHRCTLPIDRRQACLKAAEWVREVSGNIPDLDLIMLEAPFVHRVNMNASVQMAQVNGALLGGVPDTHPMSSAQPSKWKKALIDHGNANKDMITAWVAENHPRSVKHLTHAGKHDQDATDAFCIALYALSVTAMRTKMKSGKFVTRKTTKRPAA